MSWGGLQNKLHGTSILKKRKKNNASYAMLTVRNQADGFLCMVAASNKDRTVTVSGRTFCSRGSHNSIFTHFFLVDESEKNHVLLKDGCEGLWLPCAAPGRPQACN